MANNHISRWKQIANFKSYFLDFVKKDHYSFKVGIFHPERRVTFKASGHFFNEYFPDPPGPNLPDNFCPIGVMTKFNIRLYEDLIFDEDPSPEAPKTRQGNIYKHSDDFEFKNSCLPDYWILSSHSCSIEKSMFVTYNPIYLKQTLMTSIEELIFKKKWNSGRKKSAFAQIWANQNTRFIPLPNIFERFDTNTYNELGEDKNYLVVDLGQTHTFKKKKLVEKKCETSLSFEGLSYYQNRLAIQHLRDLEEDKWDDERSINSQKITT